MTYHLSPSSDKKKYLLFDDQKKAVLMEFPFDTPIELCFRIVKKLLYEYAWNRSSRVPVGEKSKHELCVIALECLHNADKKNIIIKYALEYAKRSRGSLKFWLKQQEKLRKIPVAYPDDYSDDSDDDTNIAAAVPQQFPGSQAALKNPTIVALSAEFKSRLRSMHSGYGQKEKLITSEPKAFREAIEAAYLEHRKRALGKKVYARRFYRVIQRDDGQYELTWYKNSETGQTFSIITDYEPRVFLSRGVGYFADRWDGPARRAHANELDEHALYAQAVIMELLDPGFEYDNWMAQDEEQRRELGIELDRRAARLRENLIRLRRSNPIIVKKGSDYRIFDNWLAYLQHLYTNGIERFVLLIDLLQKHVDELKGLFPGEGNMFSSWSELFIHALRYAANVKEPYADNALDVRRDDKGKPENPHLGKLYVTSHPVTDFDGWGKPHIVRELVERAQASTSNFIGPELEVSFLARVPPWRFVSAQKVRVPSFEKKGCPKHYAAKYGIDKALYGLVRQVIAKYLFNHAFRERLESYLLEYICFYHAVRLALVEFERAEKNKQFVVFLHPQGGFTTEIPGWDNAGSSRDEELEKRIARTLIENKKLKPKFYMPGGTVYAGQQLKIFEIQPEWLSGEPKQRYDRHRASFFGSAKPPRTSLDGSRLSGGTHDFSVGQTSLSASASPAGPSGEPEVFDHDTSWLFDRHDSQASSAHSISPSSMLFAADEADKLIDDGVSLPREIVLPNGGGTVWDIDVTSDGNCLFYSLIVGFLLPCAVPGNFQEFKARYQRLFPGDENAQQLFHAFFSYTGTASWARTYLYNLTQQLRTRLVAQLSVEIDVNFMAQICHAFQGNRPIPEIQTYISQMNKWGNEAELRLFARYIGVHVREFAQIADGGVGQTFDSTIAAIAPPPGVVLIAHECVNVFYMPAGGVEQGNNHYHCLMLKDRVPRFTARVVAAQAEVNELELELAQFHV